MAILPLNLPNNWPDYKVTSYIRNTSPSHKTGNTIDFAPIENKRDEEYWLRYLIGYSVIASALRKGTFRFAYPPECPHYHLEVTDTDQRYGTEMVKNKNGKCELVYIDGEPQILPVSRDFFKDWFLSFMTTPPILKLFGAYYENGILRWYTEKNLENIINETYKASFLCKATGLCRKPKVHPNGFIDDSKLQNLLDNAFGDGSAIIAIMDDVAQFFGRKNIDDVGNDFEKLLIGSGLAFVMYQLIKKHQ